MSTSSSSSSSTGGIGFLGALTLLFAAAKLFGFTSMSWWWVFSPIWIPAAFILGVIIAVVIVAVIRTFLSDRRRKRRAAARRESLGIKPPRKS